MEIALSKQQIRINDLSFSIFILNSNEDMSQPYLIIVGRWFLEKGISWDRGKYHISYLVGVEVYTL